MFRRTTVFFPSVYQITLLFFVNGTWLYFDYNSNTNIISRIAKSLTYISRIFVICLFFVCNTSLCWG